MSEHCFTVKESRDYEVVIIGGGTTGIAASIAAARTGARTALIEYNGFLGGNSAAIPAWIGFHDLRGRQVVGGIAHETIERLRDIDAATPYYMDPICSSFAGVESHWWKTLAAQMTTEAGVDVLLHSLAVDVELEQRVNRPAMTGLYVQTRDGLRRYRASAFVDCTDTGEIAHMAGAEMIRGRNTDHKVQVSSWTVTFSRVDFEKVFAHFRANPTDIRPWPLEDAEGLLNRMESQDAFVMGSFRSLIEKANADGLNLPRDNMPGIAFPRLEQIRTVAVRVQNVDPNDPENYTRSEIEGMRQVRLWYRFLREYVPGCGQILLTDTPAMIGIRETNHMVGAYLLKAEDLLKGRKFEDVIALGGYHLDIHTPDNPSSGELQQTPMYTIPYRALQPKEVDGILVAGRAISAEHRALASTRVIPISMAQGEAAGVAAALAARNGKTPREIDVSLLQNTLRERGAILD